MNQQRLGKLFGTPKRIGGRVACSAHRYIGRGISCLFLWLLAASTNAAWLIESEHHFPAASKELHEIHVLSTTDLSLFQPLIEAWQHRRPDVSVRYTIASSRSVYEAVKDDPAVADLIVSSAMDLQIKLVNDGFGLRYRSPAVAALPRWARWREQLYGFTQEPASLIISRRAFEGLQLPEDRADLARLMRDHQQRFRGRVGTYDVRQSGVGYLIATQDARKSDAFWDLMSAMGNLEPRLYCCSAEMLSDLESGELAVAYNVVGGYADATLAASSDGVIIPLSDFTHVLQRTAFIPTGSSDSALAGELIDYLVGPEAREVLTDRIGVPPIDTSALADTLRYRPVRLGPGLLVYLDHLKRERFLDSWGETLAQ